MCCSKSARALLLAMTLVLAPASNASAEKPTERYSHDSTLSIQPSDAEQTSSIAEAKQLGDGSFVVLGPEIVTCASASAFYLESESRACGLRVEKEASGLAAGMKAQVSGTMRTNASGERYIEPTEVVLDGTGALDPIGISNRALGGWPWRYDPDTHAGQQGVIGGAGLNNIGLLVRTWGMVTQIGPDYLYLDDGSNLRDGTFTGSEENIGVRVICDPMGHSSGERVQVTGVSSCFNDRRRVLLACSADDVTALGATICGTVADIDRNIVIDAEVWVNEDGRTRSLATGAYRLRGAPSGWQTVRASAVIGGEMWAGSTAVEVLENQPTMNANIVLAPASDLTNISGLVSDDTGHAVSGARVLLTTRILNPSESSPYDGTYGSLVAITGADGHYRLEDVPMGLAAVLAASKIGFDNDEIAIEEVTDEMIVDFELTPSIAQTPESPYLDSIQSYTMPSPLVAAMSMSLGAMLGGDPYDAVRSFTSPRFRESLKSRRAGTAMASPLLVMSASSLTEIDLYWNALGVNSSRYIAGYGIYRKVGDGDFGAIDFVRDPYANFYGDMRDEIEPGLGYCYRISAVDVAFLDQFGNPVPGAESPLSNEMCATPLGLLRADLPTNGASISGDPLFTWQALAGADGYMICVYDRFPTVPVSPGLVGPDYGVSPIWNSAWTDATSVTYAGPALQVGHAYYWIPVAKDPAWTAFSYGELRSFTAQ